MGWGNKVFRGDVLIAQDLRLAGDSLGHDLRKLAGVEGPQRARYESRPMVRSGGEPAVQNEMTYRTPPPETYLD